MSEFEKAERVPGEISRRTIVKGAAWATPVIAAAVATPLAAASTGQEWNIAVDAGCVVGVAGLDLLPGFTIRETTGNAPATPLTFTQTITYSGSYDWSTLVPLSKETNRAGAVAIGNTNLGLYNTATLVQGASANVSRGNWSPGLLAGATYTEGATTNGSLGARHTEFTLTRSRTITVSDLGAGGRAGLTYLFDLSTTLPGASIVNTLTANAGSGGSNSGDDSAALTWNLITIGC